jgi:hypothetical protein
VPRSRCGLVVVVCVILGFGIGIGLASSALIVVLTGARNAAYWSFVERHAIIDPLAKLCSAVLIAACGGVFAYLGYLLGNLLV